MDSSASPSTRTPAQALGMAAVTFCMIGYFVFMAGPLMRDLLQGVPPIEQLQRVEGRLQSWRGCHPVGRRSSGEDVTLVGDAGTVSVAIPCVLHGKILADGQPHRMTVLQQQTRSLGAIVYDIELDGRKLLAYADERRDRLGAGRFGLAMLGAVLVMLLALAVFAVQAFWRTWRGADVEDWREPSAEPDTTPPPAEPGLDKRAAALAMLADGNSAHAVASVFGVPEALVAQWAGEPRAPAIATIEPPRHRPASFDTTLAYESPRRVRVTIAVLCVLLVAALVPGLVWRVHASQGAPDTLINLLLLAGMTLGMAIPYRITRVRLIFGPHEIRSFGVFGSQALAYGEVGGYSLAPDRLALGRGQTIDGSRLTIVGTGDRPALSTFVYRSRPLDPRILRRLRELVDARGH